MTLFLWDAERVKERLVKLYRSLPDSESRRRRNHEPPKSGIPKRKKIAMHIGFLAKSITFSGQIMASEQLLSQQAAMPVVGLLSYTN